MNEMKFMLVGTPKKDSVWLHLDTTGHAGLSIWRNGKLAKLDHPAVWLAPFLWLLYAGPTIKVKTRGRLGFLKKQALTACIKAVEKQNRMLLVESMCTMFGFQYVNGAPLMPSPIPFTIGRMFVVEHESQATFMLGVTALPIVKAVLQ